MKSKWLALGVLLVSAGGERAWTWPLSAPEATVVDTGSTNRPGFRVSVRRDGQATVVRPNGAIEHLTLSATLCRQLLQSLEAAGPVAELPAAHCIKSVSFGSSTYVEFKGERSPDLGCPAADPRLGALRKSASDLLDAARQAAQIPASRHSITVLRPQPQ